MSARGQAWPYRASRSCDRSTPETGRVGRRPSSRGFSPTACHVFRGGSSSLRLDPACATCSQTPKTSLNINWITVHLQSIYNVRHGTGYSRAVRVHPIFAPATGPEPRTPRGRIAGVCNCGDRGASMRKTLSAFLTVSAFCLTAADVSGIRAQERETDAVGSRCRWQRVGVGRVWRRHRRRPELRRYLQSAETMLRRRPWPHPQSVRAATLRSRRPDRSLHQSEIAISSSCPPLRLRLCVALAGRTHRFGSVPSSIMDDKYDEVQTWIPRLISFH
jgi:hypothetical protein